MKPDLKSTYEDTRFIPKTGDENMKDGLFKKFWPNGHLRYEWHYKDGKRADGISKGWYSSGTLKQTQEWKDGIQTGQYTLYDTTGQKLKEGNYKEGAEEGLWTEWYKNGQKKSVNLYKNGKLIEVLNIWNGDGTLQVEDGNGEFVFWYGNPSSCKSCGFIDGDKMSNGTYMNGLREGEWKDWYRDGQLLSERFYKEGNPVGEWSFWSPDGNESSKLIHKFNQIFEGQETYWYQSGNKRLQKFYDNYKLNGKSITWYKNGQVWEELNYKNNHLDGVCTSWFSDGQQRLEKIYINGKLIEDMDFTQDPIIPWQVKNNLAAKVDNLPGNIIDVKNIKMTYGGDLEERKWTPNRSFALKEVSFSIKDGDFVTILGPPSSGKTVLMSLLSAQTKATSGNVIINNTNIFAFNEDELSYFRLHNIETLSSLEKFSKKYTHKDNDELFIMMLNMIGRFSKTEKILFADEPVGFLDNDKALKLMQTLQDINIKNKKTIIIGTRDKIGKNIKQFTNKIIRLEDGNVDEIVENIPTILPPEYVRL